MSHRNSLKRHNHLSNLNLETLESRSLLSAIPGLSPILAEKLNARLWDVAAEALSGRVHPFIQSGAARFDNAGLLQTYVCTDDVVAAKQQLRGLGARLDGSSRELGVVQAWIAPSQVDDAGLLPAVKRITLPDYAIRNVTSAGDSILSADQVRSRFDWLQFDGTGIKIGVISNGVNHRANVGGELPTINVNPAKPGNGDEGTAMLEIVHDLAPGAELYFSGVATSLDMTAGIDWLMGQGCNVIVDDITFFGEHFFSDGAVAQKAQQAVNTGVVYVTSAGNFANDQHYQGQYIQSMSAFGGGRLHQFGAGDAANNVTIPAGSTFRAFLQWSDAWGASSNNYDLYLFDSTFDQLDASLAVQNGNDQPLEWVEWTNLTGSNVQAELWVVKKDGAAAREMEMFTIGNSFMQFDTPSDALIGQEAVEGVMSVAAANASSPATVTSYSSRGGSTIYTNFATQTKTVRQTLDGTAIDGVETKVGQMGFFANPFYGTSAAAPHAAAIAALVKQANPNLTPAQVAQHMADTATDLGAVGYDTTSGAGRYNALDAVYKAWTPGFTDLVDPDDTGVSFQDNITSDTQPRFQGTMPKGSFVRLYVDGSVAGSQQLLPNAQTYLIFPSTPLSDGPHSVYLRASASNSVPVANQSAPTPTLNIVIDTTAPSLQMSSFDFEHKHRLLFDFNEDVQQSLSLDDLQLTNLTLNQTIDPASFVLDYEGGINVATFDMIGILPDGDYSAVISAPNVTDIAGNPLSAPATLDFFVLAGDANRDRAVTLQDFNILAANFGGTNKTFSQADFNYDGNVTLQDFNILAGKFGSALAPSMQAGFGESTIDDSMSTQTLEELMA